MGPQAQEERFPGGRQVFSLLDCERYLILSYLSGIGRGIPVQWRAVMNWLFYVLSTRQLLQIPYENCTDSAQPCKWSMPLERTVKSSLLNIVYLQRVSSHMTACPPGTIKSLSCYATPTSMSIRLASENAFRKKPLATMVKY